MPDGPKRKRGYMSDTGRTRNTLPPIREILQDEFGLSPRCGRSQRLIQEMESHRSISIHVAAITEWGQEGAVYCGPGIPGTFGEISFARRSPRSASGRTPLASFFRQSRMGESESPAGGELRYLSDLGRGRR